MILFFEKFHCFIFEKAFVVERCEYFKIFLHDPFNEIQTNESLKAHDLPHINIRNVSKEVFLQILFFIYTNRFSNEKVYATTTKKTRIK